MELLVDNCLCKLQRMQSSQKQQQASDIVTARTKSTNSTMAINERYAIHILVYAAIDSISIGRENTVFYDCKPLNYDYSRFFLCFFCCCPHTVRFSSGFVRSDYELSLPKSPSLYIQHSSSAFNSEYFCSRVVKMYRHKSGIT